MGEALAEARRAQSLQRWGGNYGRHGMHGTYNGGGDYKVPRPIIISHSGQPGQLGQRELPISDCSGRGDHGIRGIHGTYNAARDSLALDGEVLAEAQSAQRLA